MIDLPMGDWGQKGTWHGSVVRDRSGDVQAVCLHLCCPTCGCNAPIPKGGIDDEGIERLPFVCPYECGFNKTVRLLGWAEWKAREVDSIKPPSSGEPTGRSAS